MWQIFRQYHYLNGSLGAEIHCYVARYQYKPIAFIATAYWDETKLFSGFPISSFT